MSSAAPPTSSSGASADFAPDPVVGIIEGAGHRAGAGVVEVARLAAAAHAQRQAASRAENELVNRSTFVWALGRADVEVRTALGMSGLDVDEWGAEIGIVGKPRPTGEPYGLAEELTRALRTYVSQTSTTQVTVSTWDLAVGVFEDIARHGGLVADRLRQFGTSAEMILADLRMPSSESGAELPLVRDVAPRRFGVQLPEGAEPGPYVPRDIDGLLAAQLEMRSPVVAVVAPAVSGAIRTVYEALCLVRPDDRILLLHEWLEGRTGDQQPRLGEVEALVSSGADVVWVRNLGEMVLLHPVLEEWFPRRARRARRARR